MENVELALFGRGLSAARRHARAAVVLDRVGLEPRMHHLVTTLSGGERQRVAIARAIVNRPKLLLADEPTGNLDSRTSVEVMEIFQRLKEARGITVILITHEQQVADYGTRIIRFKDGRIVSDAENLSRRTASVELESVPVADAESA